MTLFRHHHEPDRPALLKAALDQARSLADPQRAYGSGWSARAAHAGDLSGPAAAVRN